MQHILLALILGGAFGFVLDRVGATNPGYIIKMLNLSDLHLMKTILAGIGVASVLLFGGLMAGLVDVGHMSVKDAYIGVFLGGLLLGAGFAVSGYCPGTGLTAAATGRIDALVFAIGGLVGAAAYMATYASVKSTGVLEHILGGKTTLGAIEGSGYPALLEGVSGEMAGLVVGFLLILVAFLLPQSFRGTHSLKAAE
jgi:uncharacterized protein